MRYSTIAIEFFEANRLHTQKLLRSLEETGRADEILAWRPGPGRAHIAWQCMHVAATEEIFALERLQLSQIKNPDVVDRYKHGSVPEDTAPQLSEIQNYLNESREMLTKVVSQIEDSSLEELAPGTGDRGWSFKRTLQIASWHECHHQGQSHITFNLWKASQGLL